MSIIASLRRILNDSPGTATNIDYNFQVLEDYINTSVVTTDGLNAMTGPLVVGTPIAGNHAATKGYVDSLWFTGLITEFGGDTAPAGWLLCNGGTYSSTDPLYANLFQVIKYAYGDAGGGNFKVPDYRGRTSVGPDGAQPAFTPLGKTGGSRDSELFAHAHTVPIHGHGFTGSSNQVDLSHQHSVNLDTNVGGAHNHNFGHGSSIYYVLGNQSEGAVGGGSLGRAIWNQHDGHQHNLSGFTATNHFDGGRFHTHDVGSYTVSNAAAFNTTNAGAGATLTDKNLPPYVVVNRIIKL